MTERTRSRSTTIVVPGGLYEVLSPSGAVLSSLQRPDAVKTVSETMVDHVTPEYFAILRQKGVKGLLPVNPMTHTYGYLVPDGDTTATSSSSFTGKQYTCSTGVVSSKRRVTGPVAYWKSPTQTAPLFSQYSTYVPEAPSLAYMMQEARAKCHAQGVDILTLMAEMDKSVDLISGVHKRTLSRARTVIGAAAQFARRDLDRGYRLYDRAAAVGRILSIASALWLEYRFGWRLLVKDMESLKDLYDHIENTFVVSYQRGTYEYVSETVIAETNQVDQGNLQLNGWSGSNYGYYDINLRTVAQRKVRVGVMEAFEGRRPFWGDPFVTLYELVPLSWVADMFMNTGSAIKAWSPFISGRPVHQWMTDEKTLYRRRTITPSDYVYKYGTTCYTHSDGSAASVMEVGNKVVTRTPESLQLPALGFSETINKLKLAKWADLAAVLGKFPRRLVDMAWEHL